MHSSMGVIQQYYASGVRFKGQVQAKPRIRKEIRSMTINERTRYYSALNALKNDRVRFESLFSAIFYVLFLFVTYFVCVFFNEMAIFTRSGGVVVWSFHSPTKKHNVLNLFQRLTPNVYDELANMYSGENIVRAYFGPAFPGWHQLYLYL